MDICRCKKNLTSNRTRYEWLLSTGYSQKDAAAQALYNPTHGTPSKTCCIVSLHTNMDTTSRILEREKIKEDNKKKEIEARERKIRLSWTKKNYSNQDIEMLKQKIISAGYHSLEAEAMIFNLYSPNKEQVLEFATRLIAQTQNEELRRNIATWLHDAHERKEVRDEIMNKILLPEAITVRERVTIFATDITSTVGGRFILLNADFDDPTILQRPFVRGGTGFPITNISLLTQDDADTLKFKQRPLVLWSGKIAIVPVTSVSGVDEPGFMLQHKIVDGHLSSSILHTIDKTLLQSEIIYYGKRSIDFPKIGELQVHSITLLKQFPKDIVASRQGLFI